eukprot:1159486-Pelagomonas_calceolata.AAC.5
MHNFSTTDTLPLRSGSHPHPLRHLNPQQTLCTCGSHAQINADHQHAGARACAPLEVALRSMWNLNPLNSSRLSPRSMHWRARCGPPCSAMAGCVNLSGMAREGSMGGHGREGARHGRAAWRAATWERGHGREGMGGRE